MKKVAVINLIISSVLSLIGFFIDSDINNESIATNIFEIAMMTFVLFAVITVVYFGLHFASMNIKKLFVKN